MALPTCQLGGTGARDEYVTVQFRVVGDEVLQDNLGHRRATDVARADRGHAQFRLGHASPREFLGPGW